ncbi:hypothetical protein K1719_001283 [Acacia pycnantha]|nr:hypothetical protein K1719_001283 [Acacia pycnantha]
MQCGWDSGSTFGDFDGHSRQVLSCAFKPTRLFRIVSCGEDFLVNFYDGPPFKFNMSIRDHSNSVNCVRFSPDGTKFITVSSDRKGNIYDGKINSFTKMRGINVMAEVDDRGGEDNTGDDDQCC